MALKIYGTDKLIDGSGNKPLKKTAIVVENGIIKEVCAFDRLMESSFDYYKPGYVVIPGMIDTHTHLMFGSGSSNYLEVINNDPIGEILVRSFKNAYKHLRAGVTFVRDSGSFGNIGFAIKQALDSEIYIAPKIHVCGRPITITGGHFYFFGEEADGVIGVKKSVRKLVKEGADFIKVIASGGGGTPNSDMTRPTYTTEELIAIVEESHGSGKLTEAHCLCTESIRRAVIAGIDVIDHINFLMPNGKRTFNFKIADNLIKKQLYVCPTIQTGYRKLQELKSRAEQISADDKKIMDDLSYKLESKLFIVNQLHQMGAKIIAGSDATSTFGDYSIGLELLNQAGLSVLDTINAATHLAAEGIGQGENTGLIKPGYAADFVYLERDPLDDISFINSVSTVVLDGNIVIDKDGEKDTDLQVYM